MDRNKRIKRASRILAIVTIVFMISIIKIQKSDRRIKIIETRAGTEPVVITTLKGHIDVKSSGIATVELYNDENQKLNTIQVNETGDYLFNLDKEDSYYIKVIQPGYLNFQISPIEISMGYNITLDDISMQFGDLNGDSEIELQDLIIINDNIKVLGENETSIYDSNNDKKIDRIDKERIKQNYGLINSLNDIGYSTSYSIVYNANGGENAPENQIKQNGIDIELQNSVPELKDRTFIGWSTDAESNEAEYLPSEQYQENHPLELYAIWTNTQYNITYIMNGGTNTNYNPSKYTSFDNDINLIEPTKDGYDFIGWTGSDGETPQIEVTIPLGSSGDKEFEAKWQPKSDNSYKIEYYTEDIDGVHYILSENEELQGKTDEEVTAQQIDIPGFTFDPANTNNITSGIVKFDEILTLKLYYKRNTYKVTAIPGTNIASVLGTGEYKYGGNVLVSAKLVTDSGYIFEKWSSSDTEKVDDSSEQNYSFEMPDGNLNLVATAVEIPAESAIYKVEHYQETLTTGEYTLLETETITGKIGESVVATHKTYNGFTYDSANTNCINGGTVLNDGSLVLKSYYKRNSYTLTSTAGTYIKSVTGGGTYKYGQSITLNATLQSTTGYTYTFSKWTSSDTVAIANSTTQSTTIKMPAKNLSMTASATRTAIKYTISYTLNGGSISGTNPSSYTIASSAITLINPTRTGYTFTGWTGSNGTTASKSVTIVQGSTGNKTYTANWVDNILPTAPTLTKTSGTAGNNSWYTSNVSIKVTAGTDAGSGVSKTTFSASGATTRAETTITSGNVVSISAEGTTVLTARTYDKAGNVSSAKTMTIKKDTVAPTINMSNVTLSNAVIGVDGAKVTVNGYATDSTSGISSYSYYNGSAWQTSNVIAATGTGTVFKYKAYDKAGNVSTSEQYSYFNRFIMVSQIYNKFLGRSVKMNDAYFWAITYYNDLGNNSSYSNKRIQQTAISMAFSDEGNKLTNTQFIDRLYTGFLGRNYENSTVKANTTAALNANSRRVVLCNLLKSQEYKNICTKYGFQFSNDVQ